MSEPSPLSPEQVAAYLDRIGVVAAGLPSPGPDLLRVLQRAHLLAVPFENLDIDRGVEIVLEPDSIFAKVVGRRRGGYCFELNSVFARLLRSFGFRVTLVSARIPDDGGELSPEFDHLALLVGVDVDPGADGAPDRWLVDVGFGDAVTVPLPLDSGVEVVDRGHRVRLIASTGSRGDHWDYEEDRGRGWKLWYRFTTTGHDLTAFAEMNRWQQTSPDSHFTGRLLCSRLTDWGRITLSDGRLISTRADLEGDGADRRDERPVAADDVEATLAEVFGLAR